MSPLFLVPPRLYFLDPWRWKVPEGYVARAFHSMTPRITGVLKWDSIERCVDPFTTALKWAEHMQMRGFNSVHVDHMHTYADSLIVMVVVGRQDHEYL